MRWFYRKREKESGDREKKNRKYSLMRPQTMLRYSIPSQVLCSRSLLSPCRGLREMSNWQKCPRPFQRGKCPWNSMLFLDGVVLTFLPRYIAFVFYSLRWGFPFLFFSNTLWRSTVHFCSEAQQFPGLP